MTSRVFNISDENVTSRDILPYNENCLDPCGHAFNGTETKTAPPPLASYIYKTNHFTKFHDDWAKNVTSRETNVLTKFYENWAKNVTSRVFTCFHYIHIKKNAPPTGGHVFHQSGPFSKSSEISIKPMKTALPTGGHVFQWTGTTFELNQHIIKTNILTKLHDDWA
ncbi:hypothetical protein DPMN_160827 [Dreissena polymorpha]|uniref:Uncharacterized protein n=1 Tax=Dreissena polymorpha TaxID=45954 RepID=A0A9D4ENK6_DREPO|nr:hypothetical protein DPMN_160827 [Dreissena polymorpha]